MVVYLEYAFAENFLLDGLIVYLALKISRGRVRVWRLLLSAAVGAAEAIVFPLLSLPVWSAYLVKALGGILICMIAVSEKQIKRYVFVTCAFFALTFAFGGLLTAAYSFFNVEYEEGNGFLVERAPVALVFSLVGIFAAFVLVFAKRLYRFAKIQKNIAPCMLKHKGREVKWKGLADSGNLLEFRSQPVCIFSAKAAFALFGRDLTEAGRLQIKTVNGERESPVFVAEELRVGEKAFSNVFLTVGEIESREYQLILPIAYMEGNHETVAHTSELAQSGGGKRKRRSLSLRK